MRPRVGLLFSEAGFPSLATERVVGTTARPATSDARLFLVPDGHNYAAQERIT